MVESQNKCCMRQAIGVICVQMSDGLTGVQKERKMKMKSGKCAAQIIGRIKRAENLVEPGMILDVLEGFQNSAEAMKAARKAVKSNPMADKYKIIPAY